MEWANKRIRMLLGITMMYTFIMLAMAVNFILTVTFSASNTTGLNPAFTLFIVLSMFNFMWLPSVILIVLIYRLLTKVFVFESKDKKIEVKKNE